MIAKAPTSAGISAEQKRALLARLLRRKAQAEEIRYPLSYAQKALVFFHRANPGSAAYNIAFTARLGAHTRSGDRAPVDMHALRGTFQALVVRHAALRTTFSERDEGWQGSVHGYREVCLKEIDAAACGPETLRRHIVRACREPFDLETGPLFRIFLWRHPDGDVLLLSAHHVVCDAWSLWILLDELRSLYAAKVTGAPALLPRLVHGYGDFVAWQEEMLSGPRGEQLWSYWRLQLAGDLPDMELPTDRPRPAVAAHSGASHGFRLAPGLTRRLRSLAREEKTTLYAVLLTTFQVLLHRFADRDDVVVGSPMAGRRQRELAGVVGDFVNPVALRSRRRGNPSFVSFLRTVKRRVLEALEHQDYPLLLLVERLRLRRDASRTPLYQVMLILQRPQLLGEARFEELAELFLHDSKVRRVRWGELELGPYPIPQQEGQVDLTLELVEARDGLGGTLKYRRDLFDATTAARIARCFSHLLETVTAERGRRLGDLELLDEAHRHQLLREWNDIPGKAPPARHLARLLDEPPHRVPERVGVIFDDLHLSFRELDERAGRLAGHLRRLGVGPEVRVGLAVERSLGMLVGLLGILKAGGAYLPLDPAFPGRRLAFMMADAGVAALVTGDSASADWSEATSTASVPRVVLGCDGVLRESSGAAAETGAVAASPKPENLAYLIYTSGSTGRPKGVAIRHRSVMRFLGAMRQALGPVESDTFLAVTTLSFDIAVLELFLPLAVGARLVLASRRQTGDPARLATRIERHRVSCMQATPATWRLLRTVDWGRGGSSGLRILCGGETMPSELATELLTRGDAVWNLYGPTEATVWSATGQVRPASFRGRTAASIGRPIAGTRIHLLDRSLRSVPAGVPGGLFIAGAGLARGYHRLAHLSAERFVPDPFAPRPGGRLYATGDTARFLPDGAIDFLGRRDHQVKLRGFRIELGEIEARLVRHPGVAECAVVLREHEEQGPRLLACLVPAEKNAPTSRELRRHLREAVPEYMVPAAFLTLPSLPLTPNRKVDRGALLCWASEQEAAATGADGTPRTPEQEILAAIWSTVLGRSEIDIGADFFELGGHSLLAARVAVRAGEAFSVTLSVNDLFEAPTVMALSEKIAGLKRAQQPALPPLVPVPRDGSLPLSLAQQRMWFLSRLEGSGAAYNMAGAFDLSGPLSVALFERSLEESSRRHESLRTRIRGDGGEAAQVIEPPPTRFRVPVIDLERLPAPRREAEVERQRAAEALRPFDLERDSPLRTRLMRRRPGSWVWLITLHHIVADGESIAVLLRDLATSYESLAERRPPALPALRVQYADYAHWQRRWLGDEDQRAGLDYWRRQLAAVPPRLELPTDRPRPPMQDFRGAAVALRFAAGSAEAMARLARHRRITLFMLSEAIFAVLLGRLGSQPDVVIGTPVANRRLESLEPLIGLFVNTVVLRNDLSGNPRFSELLERVYHMALEAYEHQEVPFEQVVDAVQPERDLSHSPLFQVMFTLENEPLREVSFAGLRLRLIDDGHQSAKFDLMLQLADLGGGRLTGHLEYASALFDATTIRRWGHQLRTLSEAVTADPSRHLAELPLLTAGERHMVLVAWNDTGTEPRERLFHQIFAAQAERRAHSVALVHEEEHLSYRELDGRANQLAHHLRSLDVAPERRLGLALERSTAMLVGLLGILKAGGAYVPLDPSYPKQRLSDILDDAGISILVTRSPELATLPGLAERGATAPAVVCLDRDAALVAARPRTSPASGTEPENLAYVIYTSGSTGRSKGVQIHHRGLSNMQQALFRAFGIRGNDRVLQFASLSFDASIAEIAYTLAHGATLILADREALASVEALPRLMETASTSAVTLPPTLLGRINAELPTLRLVISAGEACTHELVEKWAPNRRFVNGYGPTEVTVGAASAVRAAGQPGPLPIGRPFENARVYVLGPAAEPLAIGLVGQLSVAGTGLARGYMNRPALTAERFSPHPFSEEPGRRLYQTGDLVRFLGGGELEYLGRMDQQVKLRGFRIELGEIEEVLGRHPAVAAVAAVVWREAGETAHQLVAYVEPLRTARRSLEPRELRRFVAATLPDYMVPARFVVLDALPISPSGKIDRRRLPAPGSRHRKRFVAPRNEAERTLARIWAEVLRRRQISVDDNFFELGGDSILSLQIIARARQAGLDLRSRQVFEHQTLAELASQAGKAEQREAEKGIVRGSMPMTPIQHWFFERRLAQPWHYNQSLLLETEPEPRPDVLQRALEHLEAHHDALRLRFVSAGRNLPQPTHAEPGGPVPFLVVDLAALAPGAREAALGHVAAQLQGSLDISAGPLWRAAFFPPLDRLLITIHHLVVDGVSWRILLDDLVRTWRRLRRGAAPALPPKTTAFRDWARRLEEHASTLPVKASLEAWSDFLEADVPASPAESRDRELLHRPGVSDRVWTQFGERTTRALLEKTSRAYNTRVDDLLVAALAQALAGWTGRRAFRIDLERHGREEIFQDLDTSRTVGWFTSFFPVVIRYPSSRAPGELLKSVKETLRRVPDRGMTYGLLRYLGPREARDHLRAQPRAPLAFNYLGQIDPLLGEPPLLGMSEASPGPASGPLNVLSHAIEVNALVRGGKLRLEWVFDPAVHERPSLERLAESYFESLTSLVHHCLGVPAASFTPSDFPLAGVDQPTLDRLVADGDDVVDLYPLSPVQEGLLFHALFKPEIRLYCELFTFELRGELDAVAFERAWAQVIRRHAALRTSFCWQDLERPLQRVHRRAAVPFKAHDLSALGRVRREAEAQALSRTVRQQGFALDRVPLLRCDLLRLGPRRHRFFLTSHHILTDGWSLPIMLREVFAVYEAALRDEEAELAPPRPYRDYIVWLSRQDPEPAAAWWRRELSGFQAPSPLPGLRDGGTAGGHRQPSERALRIDGRTTESLRAACQRRHLTLNTLLQGAWALLLIRAGGEDDVVFGTTVSGRPTELEGVESMVGLFIQTLPVRARVGRRETVLPWLRDLQDRQSQRELHGHTPLVEIGDHSEVPAGIELFESLLVFENYPVDDRLRARPGGLEIAGIHSEFHTHYPLTVMAWLEPGGQQSYLRVRLQFDPDRIETHGVLRTLRHFRNLLGELATHSDRGLAALSPLDAAERHQLLTSLNDTEKSLAGRLCAHHFFEAQAELRPEALAVIFKQRALSYRELDRRATRQARGLERLGAGPEVRVGLALERSPELAVGLVAVLKAGAACVPLDTSYPRKRLELMLNEAAVPVVLTRSKLRSRLPESAEAVDLEEDTLETEAREIMTPCAKPPRPANLAYVLFTSGSTGRPKGVAMSHRSLVNLLAWQIGRSPFGGSRTLQFAPVSFDVFFQECLATWGAGGTLLMVSEERRRDFSRLVEDLDTFGVRRLFLPYVALEQLAQAAADRPTTALLPSAVGGTVAEIVTAGEQLVASASVRAFCGPWNVSLENQYGPTETHVVTACRLGAASAAWPELPPIGKPIDNVRVYVLRPDLVPAAIGEPGELLAGGTALARGYLGSPGPTAQRFLPDPTGHGLGRRLYRTGDLARWLQDGQLEFLGRADRQVKVRGFRVEPGEIEASLTAHPAVSRCAVVSSETETRERRGRLVAWVVVARGASVAPDRLRAFLADKLPPFMVPSHICELEALPLTPSGKVDRRALSGYQPEAGRSDTAPGLRAPRNPVEELLAGVWCEVLELEAVGVDESFFDLGGHSLLATRVLSRLRAVFAVDLPLKVLFDAPTLGELARAIAAARSGGPRRAAPPILPREPTTAPVPLSFAQQRLWFLDRWQPEKAVYNIPGMLRLWGRLDIAALWRVFAHLTRRHEILRTNFVATGGEPCQIIHPAARAEAHRLPVIDLTGVDGENREAEVERLAAAEALRPFELSAGGLWRTTLLRLTGREHVLLLGLHHIVADGWSLGILVREMAALYTAFAAGRPSPLAGLSIQYADFALWQHRWLSGPILDEQLAYWRRRLGGADGSGVSALELPLDRPRPPVRGSLGAFEDFTADPWMVRALKVSSRRRGATLFMTLLATFQVLLRRYSGRHDLMVGTPIANRTRSEVEPLIGFFVNTLVLRQDLSGNPTFAGLVDRVRQTALEAYAHQDLPFERLVEVLALPRDPSRPPLFQVMFAFESTAVPAPGLPEIEVRQTAIRAPVAKFDLTLSVREAGDGAEGVLEYSTDLFDALTIRRMAGHLRTLWAAVAANPDQRIDDTAWLGRAERHQLCLEWNPVPNGPDTATRPTHRLFEDQVERMPEAIAVEEAAAGNGPRRTIRMLTYRELGHRADRLARGLRVKGVGPEVPVGVLVERPVERVVALLAVFKAGGAYLPLDPEHPRERLNRVLMHAGAKVLLSDLRWAAGVDIPRIFPTDTENGRPDRLDAEAPFPGTAPENLAYLLPTSGSTGRPRVVQVSHGALAEHCRSVAERYAVSAGDRVLQLASPSFDPSLEQILLPLLDGARLVVRGARLWEPARFSELVRERRLTLVNLPPAYWRSWVLGTEPREPARSSLRLVVVGGDVLPAEILPHWHRLAEQPIRLLNAYGPTEATVTATTYEVAADCGTGRRTPIGRPLGRRTAAVLDRRGRRTAQNIPGELCLGGSSLARGYLGQPGLTARCFVPDAEAVAPGARLYRTGDLARFLPCANLDFLGRRDFQVKLHGVRIEPAEIETGLCEHPDVHESCVILRENGSNERLVAFLGAPNRRPEAGELRRFLDARMPRSLLPSSYVVMDRLPRTPSGKVDRRALVEVPVHDRSTAGIVPPRNPTEELLATTWCELLETGQAGLDDDFFELGGHSLLAMRLAARVRDEMGVELSLHTLFESPTLRQMAASIERSQAGGAGVDLPRVERACEHGPLPLSFSQMRFWLLSELEEENAAYNVPAALDLEGPLDLFALTRGLARIIERHEILRTSFPALDGQPVQVTAPPAPFRLPAVDLSALSDRARPAVLRRLLSVETRRHFRLTHGPLVRFVLVRSGRRRHALFVNMHHIVSDAWSAEILLRELGVHYEAVRRRAPAPLAEPEIRYADYALWQRHWLSGERLEIQVDAWRRRLAGAPELLELPTDRPRPAVQTFGGNTLPVRFEPGHARAFAEPGRRGRSAGEPRVTPFMTLFAAFAILLSRYSAQTDVVVGFPIANRRRPEVESVVGCFVNTLVLRLDLNGRPRFSELLGQVRRRTLEAFAHQDLPFELLVERLRPERSLSHTPLFQVLFAWQTAAHPSLQIPGVEVTPIEIQTSTSRFDLSLNLEDGGLAQGGPLSGVVEYNVALFDESTVLRMAGHLGNLLTAVVADPLRRLDEVILLGAAQIHQLSTAWNDTRVDRAGPSLVYELFAARAARIPDALAVAFDGDLPCRLSYGELAARAHRLARRLRRHAVGPDVLVGLFSERSPELVTALLGVLAAGGAYVPLDPDYPRDRLAYMVRDAGLSVLLVERRLRRRLSAIVVPGDDARRTVPPILTLGESDAPAEPAASPPNRGVLPQNLAYVIYTSGSTGRPKGAMNPHGALANRLLWMQETYRLSSEDRVLQKTPFSFDVSVWEFFWPLVTGATLVLARPGGHRDNAYLARLIAEQEITTLHFVPSMLRLFLETPGVGRLRSLENVMVSGEALSFELQQEYFRHLAASLHNLYGPTEAAIDVTFRKCSPAQAPGPVPLGRPIANLRIHILDPAGRAVPAGVPGELFIAGAGVGRGYLGRPALTGERFLADPFSTEPGARMYRAGDLSRYLPDGEIEFLGRADHQVKVRGFRIELGEIEALLEECPEIRQAVVVDREAPSGDRHLVAYLVTENGGEEVAESVRERLRRRLPDYMVPWRFVALDEMPGLPNGKVDRTALRRRDPALPEDEPAVLRRDSPVEDLLCDIWRAVLGIEDATGLGRHRSFFELGGHSLSAARVNLRVRRAFGVDLPLRTIFEAPTLAQLAARIEAARRGGIPKAPPLVPVPRDRPDDLPLSYAQQRLWFLEKLVPGSAQYNIPTTLEVLGEPLVEALRRAFEEIVRRHEVLRTRFTEVAGRCRQSIHPPGSWALPVVDLGRLGEAARREGLRLASAEARRPFDLAGGPMLRTTLVRLSDRRHLLLLTLHHIASDGWSMEVLGRELALLYGAFAAGERSPLPELPVQYADYAHWQKRWLEGEVFEAQLAYWRRRLAGAPVLELATGRRRAGTAGGNRGAEHPFTLPESLTTAIDELTRRHQATHFMTLFAVLALLLERYSGQQDLCVGTPVAHRDPPVTEKLLGLFLNTLTLRIDLSDRPTFVELLERARETTLDAFAHQDLPFDRLVDGLGIARETLRSPLHRVFFVLHNTPRAEPELAGRRGRIRLEPVHVETTVAKWDLALSIHQVSDALAGTWTYDSALFTPETIAGMSRFYELLLAQVTARPEATVDELLEHTRAEETARDHAWLKAEKPTLRRLQKRQKRQVRRTMNDEHP